MRRRDWKRISQFQKDSPVINPQPGDYACVQIPTVNFLGFRVPNVVGLLIRLFTRSRFDHAFIYVGSDYSRDSKTPMIVEARPHGAVIAALSEYDGDLIVWSQDDLTPEQRTEIVAQAVARVGTPYGFLDIAYIGLARLGLSWGWLLRRVETQRRLICSQLVAVCGVDAEETSWLCGQPDPCLVTPADLGNRIRSSVRDLGPGLT